VRRAKILLALAVTIVAPACDEGAPGCTPNVVAGLSVTVQDDETGLGICDAIVTARDGAHSEVLSASLPPSCRYSGAIEREGVYTVRVERAGYISKTVSNLVVESSGGDCPHVRTVPVTIRLEPGS
jgi:hypothetical protein